MCAFCADDLQNSAVPLFSISFFAVIVNARLQFLLFFAVILPKNVCKKKKNVLKYLQVSSLIGVSPAFPGLTPNFLFFGGIKNSMQQTPQQQPQNRMGMQKIPALLVSPLDESSVVSKSDVISSTQTALHIATLGYLFMGVSVAIQGVLQGFGEIYTPLIISVLRLIFPTLPLVYLFTLRKNAAAMIWWAFPISEVVAAAVSCAFLLRRIHKQTKMQQTSPNDAQNHAPDL